MTPDEISLWIVSFRRLESLRLTISGWLASFPFTEVNVIANDVATDYTAIEAEFYPLVKVRRNFWRESWETGSIAWCWNQAMKHTFETRDWCMLSQDDVGVLPGWDKLVGDYDYYLAPHGDTCQLQSLAGFSAIGWFDERFRAIGGPEADYELRALQACPDRVSVHDEHVWQMRHNDVGLAAHWHLPPKHGETLATRLEFNGPYHDAECFGRWIDKWGMGVDELFLGGHLDRVRQPGWDEIDWYPSFTRRLAGLGRR